MGHYLLPKLPAITLQSFEAELKNAANSKSVTFPACAFIMFCKSDVHVQYLPGMFGCLKRKIQATSLCLTFLGKPN